ncbi:MAG: hypothetical protein JHC33_09815 [Ignisphaera sp.]|nr:hypothetical protein [Ignisphaera sp.]
MFMPLDIVQTKSGAIAIIVEVYIDSEGYENVSLRYLASMKNTEKCSWWSNQKFASATDDMLDDLVLLDSIPHLLSNCVAHNMGVNTGQGNRFFPLSANKRNNHAT